MSKSFTYTKITSKYYLDYTDEWEEDGVEFEYEVSSKKCIEAISDILIEEYFYDFEDKKEIKSRLQDMISDNDMEETLAERYEEELKDIFREEAFDNFGG